MENASREGQGFAALSGCVHCGAPFTPVVAGQTLCDRCQGLAQPDPRSPLQQAEIAGFTLRHELGAGRFAHSWLGEDSRSHAVVVKLLRRYAPDPNAVQRFLAEAQRLVASPELDHPHVARPLGAGVHLVQAFFLVYQNGGQLTLADELRQRGRVAAPRALELCAQVAEGLAAIHRCFLLHLDLKPANVGLTRLSDGTEQAVVLDAVTSHLLAHIGLREGSLLPLSSAAYMSPEEAAGRRVDARSDLYALGVLLFQLLSGRLPLMGATAEELLQAHREQPPLRLRDVDRRVHDDVEAVIARLLSKDPLQRPPNGDEAAVILRAIAPIAEVAPRHAVLELVEDPIPVVDPSQPPAPPPQMLPPPVDPLLERAMMGQVPPPPPERAPGIPKWAAFVPPRWWPYAAAAGVAAIALVGSVVLFRTRTKPRHDLPVTVATAGEPVAQAPAAAAPPPVAVEPAPAEPEPAISKPPLLTQLAASPYAKNFDRAQKALWTNRPAGAVTILRDVLRKPDLTRRDRARASKMMGDAEAKKGNRARAAEWWRKSFGLYDDPQERAKVARLLHK